MGNCVAQPIRPTTSSKSACTDASEQPPPSGSAPAGYLLDAQHSKTAVTDRFDLKQPVGRGSYAVTRLAVERCSGRHFACKSIEKAGLSHDERRRVRREVSVMYHVSGHPNIVRLAEAFEDATHVHLVMELCSGGEIVKRIMDKGTYSERDAASILRSVLEAVAYAHDMGCMHRDIKIDNCLMLDASPDSPVKLIDWGYSTFIKPGRRLRKLCGTVYYLAPEVVAGSYNEKADVWSCGVMLYAMLAGRLPFNGKTQEEVMRTIKSESRGVPDMSGAPWQGISAQAKAAVGAMMTRDPAARPSAREMLRHAWIRERGAAGDEPLEPEVLHRVRSFANMSALKKHAALVIARHLPADQVLGLKLLFESMDRCSTGAITADSLREALERRGCPHLDQAVIEEIVDHADLSGAHRLDYPEFVAAALHPSALSAEPALLDAFHRLDRDGDGAITPGELAAALREETGAALSGEEAAAMVGGADEDGDGAIDYQEFKHLMRGGQTSCAASAVGLASTHPSSAVIAAPDDDDDSGYYDLY